MEDSSSNRSSEFCATSKIAGAEATAQLSLERIHEEPDRVLMLRDAIVLLLDELSHQYDRETQNEILATLGRVVPRSVGVLHESRQLIETSTSKANPVLRAMLSTLTALADRQDDTLVEVISTLVQLAHQVCRTSMSSADVVLLFDFLRLSRSPARKMVLQMLMSLLEGETMPRAVFTMRGTHAGIITPSTNVLFSKKGYTLSFGLLLEAHASVVSLYSFRGATGQGISGMIEGSNLVLRTHGANGATAQVVVSFTDWRPKMEVTWVHVCIVHAKKMLFKDKVSVYVEGGHVFNGNLSYPDPLSMVGGQNCIGVIPTVSAGFQGWMWSPTLFGQPLSESDAQKLHWTTHWKSDLGSVTAENMGLSDKSKFIFSYDARSCDIEKRVCFDVSGNECHGWMEPGTKPFVTQGLRHVMDSVGGSACFLLLLLDQIPELADFHPKQEMSQDEISDLLSFVGLGLRSSVACRAHFIRLQGVKVLAFIIQSISPRYLTPRVLGSVTDILESIVKATTSLDDASNYIQLLFFRNTNWFLSPFDTQVKLLSEVLPSYLRVLEDIWASQSAAQKGSGMAAATSAMEALGLVATATPSPMILASSSRTIDVNFFCNLLMQVYSPRLCCDGCTESDGDERKTKQQMTTLRIFIIDHLIERLLFPSNPDDDLHHWRQLFAHIHRRCNKLTAVGFMEEGDGVEVRELLSYLTDILLNDATPQRRHVMTTKICKLSQGSLRIWWHAMYSHVPQIRLEALRLFEAYCADKVVLKRRDVVMLLSSHQGYPIDSDSSDVLLDLLIGRKHVSYYGNSITTGTMGSGAGRSINAARLEYIPFILLNLISEASYQVQAHVLFEIKSLLGSASFGLTAIEGLRSWPPLLSRLRGIMRQAQDACASEMKSGVNDGELLDDHMLNDVCIVLSDENGSVSAKLEAIGTITKSGDIRGCDFALGLVQNTELPASLTKAIVTMIQERFPSRCALLVVRISKQITVDVIVYSILHVRNGWLHFLEFIFCGCENPSQLSDMIVVILDRLIRRIGTKGSSCTVTGQTVSDHADFKWENLSQVVSIVSMIQRLLQCCPDYDYNLSPCQAKSLSRKTCELWTFILPRLHLINWEDMKGQLDLNATFTDDIPVEETEIFSHIAIESSLARFLALKSACQYVRLVDESKDMDGGTVTDYKKIVELLRLVPVNLRSSVGALPASVSHHRNSFSPPPTTGSSTTDVLIAYTADTTAFFAEINGSEGTLPRELVQLYALDTVYDVLVSEVSSSRCFKTALTLVELAVSLASAALRLQSSSDVPSSTSGEVTKTLQIISSTDLTFFQDSSQLQQLVSLWSVHHQAHKTFFDPRLLSKVENSNAPFLNRWARLLNRSSTEFNPFLIHKDASIQADILVKETKSCESFWQDFLNETAVTDEVLMETMQGEDNGIPSSLKQDAEKFASSVHKLIVTSTRDNRGNSADQTESSSEQVQYTPSANPSIAPYCAGSVLHKVNSRENSLRMRLRMKQVQENYRLRNLSCECGDPSLADDDRGRASSYHVGPRRFRSAKDSIGLIAGGRDPDKTWYSDAGSDYSDFLADAQMRAAIIKSTPSVGSDRDSFGGGLSDEDDNGFDDDDLDCQDSDETNESAEVAFENEANELLKQGSSEGDGNTQEPATPVIQIPNKPSVATTSNPSSPLGSLSGFGASLLSVVGGVTDLVTKAAKDAKDAVELGVDSLYTARDALSDEAKTLVQEVSISVADGPPKTASNDPTTVINTAQDGCRRLSVDIPANSPTISIQDTSKEPVLFPPSPPVKSKVPPSKGTSERSKNVTGSAMSKREMEFDANLVRHMHIVSGKILLTETHLWFVAERVIDEQDSVLAERKRGVQIESAWRFLFKRRRWKFDDIVSINRRRFLLKPTAIEIFIQSTRKNYFFSLAVEDVSRFHEVLMSRRPLLLRRDPTMRRLRHPASIFRNSNMSVRWMNHEISTFEYLMWLNTIAGRTYNDLTQYPVFPWIIADYDSPSLDLAREATFRDLSKPIGALEPTRLRFFLDRYNAFEDSDIPKFMYGTHYSNIGVVLYNLIRLEPFTSYALSVQGGKFDHADRLFHSIPETWKNCLTDFNDLKELTPEWFYLPEFLKNCNNLELGIKQNGVALGDVVLPPWATSPEDFVLKNFMALESEYVSLHIHKWIDLVFGAAQRGQAAVDANNVFFYLTYEGMVDVDSITDPITKSSMRAQIAHFGQTPTQVLRDPHPQRMISTHRAPFPRQTSAVNQIQEITVGSTIARTPSGLKSSASLSYGKWTTIQVPHDHPVTNLHLVPGTSTMLCIDCCGQLSTQRYGTKSVKVHHTPFLNDLSSTATKASGVFKPSTTPPTSSGMLASAVSDQLSGIDASNEGPHVVADYIEVHDRRARKIIGEKRLVNQDQSSYLSQVAFLNAGAVYCSVGHHDFSARFHSSNDGALLYRLLQHSSIVRCVSSSVNGSLLALGSSDGTISVWKVAHIASTLLDSIKIFRASKHHSRPVHANDYSADQVLLGHALPVNCVAVSDDLGICVSGSMANECIAHDLGDGSIVQQYLVEGNEAPGVISVTLSNNGLLLVQSMGSGSPMLYVFHLNGSLVAKNLIDGGRPMRSLSVCARFLKVIVSNADVAIAYSALSLQEKEVLLTKDDHGEIFCHTLSPDETHVVFGVGTGKVASLSLLPRAQALSSSASPCASFSSSMATQSHIATTGVL